MSKAAVHRVLAFFALTAALILGVNLAWNLHEAAPPRTVTPAQAEIQNEPTPALRVRGDGKKAVAPQAAVAAAPMASAPAPQSSAAPPLTESQKIDRLIAYVGNLKSAVFIRNGDEHTAIEAAKHLQMKREKAGDRVKTADDFIRLCASKSYWSGKAYQIRLADGRTRSAEDVLREELARLEK